MFNNSKKENDNKDSGFKAVAYANLALVKYFGKRDISLNLPAAPSLSIALEPLCTETEILFLSEEEKDLVFLNGKAIENSFSEKVTKFLDLIRNLCGISHRAVVTTANNFPTAAGLASSASGFAALATAASAALNLKLSEQELSVLARRGSGSAARSVSGGISVWQMGVKADGSDSYAYRIAERNELDLRVVVGVTDPSPKAIGSTQAMEHTRYTSPYYNRWIETVHSDIKAAERAVQDKDIVRLGEIAEANALAMHAAALAARPGILFWNGITVEGLHLVQRLRKSGLIAYFTCDAGPQPKILCTPDDEPKVAEALSSLPGIVNIIRCKIGCGSHIVSKETLP